MAPRVSGPAGKFDTTLSGGVVSCRAVGALPAVSGPQCWSAQEASRLIFYLGVSELQQWLGDVRMQQVRL